MTKRDRTWRGSILRIGLTLFWLSSTTLSGCAPSTVTPRLTTSVPSDATRWSNDQVVIYVLPYTSDMERTAFGVDLHDDEQMAVELKVELATPNDDGAAVILRRQDIALVFKDGTRRYPLDPMKVYEKQRINTTGIAMAFGIMGASIASDENDKHQKLFAGSAFDEIRLSRSAPRAVGFVFFDSSGTGQPAGNSLAIEYEDGAGDVHKAQIAL